MDLFRNLSATSIESFDENKQYAHGIFNNGLWRKTTTPLGTFTHKIQDMPKNLGLSKDCEVSFERNEDIPKIPYTIYFEILEYYKHVYKTISSEVYTCIVWDKEAKDFFIHIPYQEVSGAQVKFENDDELFQNPNYVAYCDIHSHNVMDAFFSAGDVKDEVGGRYYGVIGKITTEPKAVFKVSYDRQFTDVNILDLFDQEVAALHPHSDYTIDREAVEAKVVEYRPKVSTYLPNIPKKAGAKADAATYPYDDDFDYTYGNYSGYGSGYGGNNDYYGNYDNYGTSASGGIDYTVKDLTLKTTLVAKKFQKPYQTFAYDFRQVFANSNTIQDSSITNLYNSLTELILSEGIIIDDECLTNIIGELCLSLSIE